MIRYINVAGFDGKWRYSCSRFDMPNTHRNENNENKMLYAMKIG